MFFFFFCVSCFVPCLALSARKIKYRMFSGCEDEQTSADVHDVAKFGLPDASGAGGACTNAVLANVVS